MRPLWITEQAATGRGARAGGDPAGGGPGRPEPGRLRRHGDQAAARCHRCRRARRAGAPAQPGPDPVRLRSGLGPARAERGGPRAVRLSAGRRSRRGDPRAAAANDLDAFVARFRPAQDEYRRLQAALAEFRARAASGADWGAVPEGPTLEPGASDPRVALLRARLLGIQRCRGGAPGRGDAGGARILRRAAGGRGDPLPAAPRPRAGRQGRAEDARGAERADRAAHPADGAQSRAPPLDARRPRRPATCSSTSPTSSSRSCTSRGPCSTPGWWSARPTIARRRSAPR